MAITGTGTQNDPFVVHGYDEFISLSEHAAVENSSVYIKFFDEPNQTINCNSYGSEFKWGQFKANRDVTVYIDLNGCTIKNVLIDANKAMFYAVGGNDTYPHWHAAVIKISNGSFLNVFVSDASSRIAQGQVEFSNVAISTNTSSATTIPIQGVASDKPCKIDNCALYWQHATLSTALMKFCTVTDTDFELHIDDQNNNPMFSDCSYTDCRFQGKISGRAYRNSINEDAVVLGYNIGGNSQSHRVILTNCVADLDLTDSYGTPNYYGRNYYIYNTYNDASLNTNVFCNSHYPSAGTTYQYNYSTAWNYMPHEGNDGKNIRNGAYLNSKGFVVVQVS